MPDSISAYGVFAHRHAAEIDQELGVPVMYFFDGFRTSHEENR